MGAKLINLIDKPLIYALNSHFSCKIIDYLIIFLLFLVFLQSKS